MSKPSIVVIQIKYLNPKDRSSYVVHIASKNKKSAVDFLMSKVPGAMIESISMQGFLDILAFDAEDYFLNKKENNKSKEKTKKKDQPKEEKLLFDNKKVEINNDSDNGMQGNFICPDCGEVFSSEKGMKIHISKSHMKNSDLQ